MLAISVLILISILVYNHKKYRYRSRAVATCQSSPPLHESCNVIGVSHGRMYPSRGRTRNRPGHLPINTRHYALYTAGYSSYGVPLTAIPPAAFLPLTGHPVLPPYTPREAPPAYTPEPINLQPHQGVQTFSPYQAKPPSPDSDSRY